MGLARVLANLKRPISAAVNAPKTELGRLLQALQWLIILKSASPTACHSTLSALEATLPA